MKTFGLRKTAMLLSAFATLALWSCNTEEVDYQTPEIKVDESIAEMPVSGGSVEIDVESNRPWTVQIPEGTTWLAADPMSGNGNGKVTLTALSNDTYDREVTIKIATSTVYEAIRVSQAGTISVTEMFADDFGATSSGNPWVADFDGWNMAGAGASTAYYTGVTASVRTSLNASASKGNVIFFGNTVPAVFTINDISVTGMTGATFSFGISKAAGTAYTTVDKSEMAVYWKTDNAADWTRLDYAVSSGDAWVTATVDFTAPAGARMLSIKFESSVVSVYRIDDVKLTAQGKIIIPPAPKMTTGDVTNLAETSVTLGGSYVYTDPDPTITALGIAYKKGTDADFTNKPAASASTTPYTVDVTGLSQSTDYVYKAYATMSDGNTYYGAEKAFRTKTAYTPPTPVTLFKDDFQTITATNVAYTGNNWGFYSSDDSNVNYGWKTGIFNTTDKYIQIAPYGSTQATVTAYAIMPPVNVQGASVKKLFYNLAYYYTNTMTEYDGTKFEVVASTDYAGDAVSATWAVIDNGTRSFGVDPVNEWALRSVDLSASYYTNTNLTIAFRYTGKGITYRLDDVTFGVNVGVTYGTPSLEGVGTLKEGAAIPADAKVLIPYKFGNGVAVSITATSSIAGITIAPYNGSLQNGNGDEADIELAVSGTPAASGTLTITISGLAGLTTNTITAEVAPAGSSGGAVLADVSLGGLTGTTQTNPYIFTDGTVLEKTATAAGDIPATLSYTASNSSFYINNWDKSGSAWVITTPAVAAEVSGNVELAINAYGTATSPKNWKVQYSNDKINWVDGTTYDVTATAAPGDAYTLTFAVSATNKVPAGGKLYIKLMPSTTTSIGDGTTASGGNSRLVGTIKITKLAQ